MKLLNFLFGSRYRMEDDARWLKSRLRYAISRERWLLNHIEGDESSRRWALEHYNDFFLSGLLKEESRAKQEDAGERLD